MSSPRRDNDSAALRIITSIGSVSECRTDSLPGQEQVPGQGRFVAAFFGVAASIPDCHFSTYLQHVSILAQVFTTDPPTQLSAFNGADSDDDRMRRITVTALPLRDLLNGHAHQKGDFGQYVPIWSNGYLFAPKYLLEQQRA